MMDFSANWIGIRVYGNWGAMFPWDFGFISKTNEDGSAIITWDRKSNREAATTMQVKLDDIRSEWPQTGSPVGIYLDRE